MKFGLLPQSLLKCSTPVCQFVNNHPHLCSLLLFLSLLTFSSSFNLLFFSLFIYPPHTLIFIVIGHCHCLVSPSGAISHSFLSFNSVNLNPVLHQFISLWSWTVERVERRAEADERHCTNQPLLPDLVHKDKGLLSRLCLPISPSLPSSLSRNLLSVLSRRC